LSAFGVLAIASPARASTVNCNITNIAWHSDVGGGELQLYCSGNWYYADITGTGACSAKGSDSVRSWLSLAQAAYLAGKGTTIQFTTSGTTFCMNYLKLN
jgi:hypothetical protein